MAPGAMPLYQSDKSDPQEALSDSGNEKFPLRGRPNLENKTDVDEEVAGGFLLLDIAAFFHAPPHQPSPLVGGLSITHKS